MKLTNKFVKDTTLKILAFPITASEEAIIAKIIEELVMEREYSLEITKSYENDYIISATRYTDQDEEEFAVSQEYAFSNAKTLHQALMEVLVKTGGE
jgi:hypothetical protein